MATKWGPEISKTTKFLGPGWGDGHCAPEWLSWKWYPRFLRESFSKKSPFHFWGKEKSGDQVIKKWLPMITSTRCKGSVRCKAAIHSWHLSKSPSAQSLHLIIPAAFSQFEHLLWPKKLPSPSWRRASSKNAVLNWIHSVSRCWQEFNLIFLSPKIERITYCIRHISLLLGLNCRLLCLRYWFVMNFSVGLNGQLGLWGWWTWSSWAMSWSEDPVLGLQDATLFVRLAYCDK